MGATQKVKDLKLADYNPRKISDSQLKSLKKAMQEYGDLSGIVVNVKTVSNLRPFAANPRGAISLIIKKARIGHGRIRSCLLVRCDVCDRDFYKPLSAIRRRPTGAHCCSVICRIQHQKAYVTGPNSKRWKGGPVTRICTICESVFVRKQDQIKTRNSVFCSTGCFGVWKSRTWIKENHHQWKGGYKYKHGAEAYHGGWDRIRKAIRKRDGSKCVQCGSNDARLHVHHIIPLRLCCTPVEANHENNLITLCQSCHAIAESKIRANGNTDTSYKTA